MKSITVGMEKLSFYINPKLLCLRQYQIAIFILSGSLQINITTFKVIFIKVPINYEIHMYCSLYKFASSFSYNCLEEELQSIKKYICKVNLHSLLIKKIVYPI